MHDDESDRFESFLCHNCLSRNESTSLFCWHCGSPLTPIATTMPLESVFAYGDLLRKLARHHPSRLAFIGAWLLLGPEVLTGIALIVAAAMALSRASSRGWELEDIAYAVGAFFTLLLYAMMGVVLFRVTLHYFRDPPPPPLPDYDEESLETET